MCIRDRFAFIQDDIIDREIEDKDISKMIVLGNLYFSEFMSIYRKVFKNHEKIWDYYDFYDDLKEVFERCNKIISKYPEGLKDAGIKLSLIHI